MYIPRADEVEVDSLAEQQHRLASAAHAAEPFGDLTERAERHLRALDALDSSRCRRVGTRTDEGGVAAPKPVFWETVGESIF